MLIRLGFDIEFQLPWATPFIVLLNVHPSREGDLLEPDTITVEPEVPIRYYRDSFGNRCARFLAQPGRVRIHNNTLIQDSGELDQANPDAKETPIHELPDEVLQFLLPSRYCEVDQLTAAATDLFGDVATGYKRIEAVCSWVYQKVRFGYGLSRPTKTALDVFTERTGVCRDFQHLAITFCRALNIPARYATGYLGDIGVPPAPSAMDFSAWFEAFLDGRWWTFDARHNARRIGRVLMATGRDAADVAITTSFGVSNLTQFTVISDEVKDQMVDSSDSSAPTRVVVAANGA